MPDGMQPSPAPMAGAKPPMVPPGSTAPATMAPDSQGLQMRGVIQITPHIKGLERAVSYVGSQTPEGQAILKALAILSKAFGTASGDLTRAEMKIMSETAPPIAPPSGTAIAQMHKRMGIGGGAPAQSPSPTPEPAGMAGAA